MSSSGMFDRASTKRRLPGQKVLPLLAVCVLFGFSSAKSHALPDLTFTSGPTVTSSLELPSGGGTLDVSYVEFNNGQGNFFQKIASAHTNTLFLSSDLTIGNGDDIELSPTDSASLMLGGSSRNVDITVNVPGIPGTYYVYVSLDSGGQVNEEDESNNLVMNTDQQVIVGPPPTNTPTPTSTLTPTDTPTLPPDVTPSPTPTASHTPTSTNTPTATPTPTLGTSGPDLRLSYGPNITRKFKVLKIV